MDRANLMNENADKRYFWFMIIRHIPQILIGTLLSAIIFGGVFYMDKLVVHPNNLYTTEFVMYLEFKEGMYEQDQYYNAYTWTEISTTDKILGEAVELLPEDYTREEVLDAMDIKLYSDVRVLTGYVRTESPERSDQIAEALINAFEAFPSFPDQAKVFESISLWKYEKARILPVNLNPTGMIALGTIIGLIIITSVIFIRYCVQNGVITTEQFKYRYGVNALGIYDLKGQPIREKETALNMSLIDNAEKVNIINLDCNEEYLKTALHENCLMYQDLTNEQYKELRNSVNLIAVKWGAGNGTTIAHALDQLDTQKVKIYGALICMADRKVIKAYYR